jgi:hypothetical protein
MTTTYENTLLVEAILRNDGESWSVEYQVCGETIGHKGFDDCLEAHLGAARALQKYSDAGYHTSLTMA